MITLEQVFLSLLVNAAALILVLNLKSAPPRFVLCICLAGMIAIFIPWSFIGTGVEHVIPADALVEIKASSSTSASLAPELVNTTIQSFLGMIWLTIGVTWLLASILRALYTRKAWRAKALCGKAFTKYADPTFDSILRNISINRLPNSSSVFTTGQWNPEIWIGDNIQEPEQIKSALNHELAHIDNSDQYTLFLMVTLERLLWWNPLVWILGKQARLQMEYACDSRCQTLIGTETYRRSLAELFLVQQPPINALELSLVNKSDIITRMEKIGMTQLLKPNHIIKLVLVGSLTAVASASIAAKSSTASPTLIECHELLPEGVQYEFRITSEIDTREGQDNGLSISLVDTLKPESRELPAGADAFLQCVQKVVGIGQESGWPKT